MKLLHTLLALLYLISFTSIPLISISPHILSAVYTGMLKYLPNAKQALSPSDKPYLRSLFIISSSAVIYACSSLYVIILPISLSIINLTSLIGILCLEVSIAAHSATLTLDITESFNNFPANSDPISLLINANNTELSTTNLLTFSLLRSLFQLPYFSSLLVLQLVMCPVVYIYLPDHVLLIILGLN
ncbi:hypothetical protein NF27_DO00030 [Candidatus Jidaibacter acanthamoeba]|uniref:Uncharacterized protein n=1 Tax=Candidatus Jidaibacter acanthamoebae TaxID=86105 RepID=A0A0C1N035_9RICK|nr:hypothetical protein NF27_DO00030 [Candidatus Jidaibacter acanthamoeba]